MTSDLHEPSTRSSAFRFTGRLRSFRFAFRGAGLMLRSQRNAWIHLAVTIVVIGLGAGMILSSIEWCAIVAAIALVWVAEGMNMAFEFLCDVTSPEFHPLVEKAKDVAAGAVLITAVGALAIGALVFVPYLTALLGFGR